MYMHYFVHSCLPSSLVDTLYHKHHWRCYNHYICSNMFVYSSDHRIHMDTLKSITDMNRLHVWKKYLTKKFIHLYNDPLKFYSRIVFKKIAFCKYNYVVDSCLPSSLVYILYHKHHWRCYNHRKCHCILVYSSDHRILWYTLKK